jgi:hypothetical protein
MPNVSRSIPARETNSPTGKFNSIKPSNMRDVIQRQIRQSISSSMDQANFGNGDGGFGYQYELINMRDGQGRQYHLVGINTSNDWSVAGP